MSSSSNHSTGNKNSISKLYTDIIKAKQRDRAKPSFRARFFVLGFLSHNFDSTFNSIQADIANDS